MLSEQVQKLRSDSHFIEIGRTTRAFPSTEFAPDFSRSTVDVVVGSCTLRVEEYSGAKTER